jgi:hypothetical protein
VAALRNLSAVGGSVRSMVVMGAVHAGGKKAHIKNYFRETFIILSLLKQKVVETEALLIIPPT